MIYTLTFRLKPSNDVIVPPFTSKLSRTLFLSFSPTYSKIIESKKPNKPLRITVVKDQGRPLYSNGKSKVVLKAENTYTFIVNTLLEDVVKEVIKAESVNREIYNTSFHVELENVSVKENIMVEDARFYRVHFKTPTLLQPPRPRIKRKENRYVLFPYVPLLFYSTVSHWNTYMDKKIVGVTGSKTLYYFREVNYRIRPMTAYYGNIPNKGFVGWVVFELSARKGSKIRENVRRLLDYVNYFGVGKSRNIGFGEVEVKPLNG
ncbi:CRISPR-associated protein Cas6 [Sulfolobus islandicus M.14.25]|uniref:CRISPR-associated protein Cas6 n=2 Tax=Saccharolobus islandicus TaxID=43080 RepID=C3MWK7_SACI4|nr:CRISPR-associated endoribonuclease Cas6 [Sulfolobus islandicus]ACP37665.1 CRISPR-associated protein Cas6 [Sulfolobus islandicus M.14.25]ACP54861.1 CRISPR-associated protein Cas6 [Sulfolobus islandicus M.16.27]